MTTPTAAPATGLIPSLVGIRGALSAIVVAVHLAPFAVGLVPAPAPVWNAVWHGGYVALDVFFVLSGYVVTTGYGRRFARWPGRATYGRFLLARLSRFYPVHLAVLAALAAAAVVGPALGLTVHHTGNLGSDLLRNLLLLQGWGGARGLTWNGPAWSLSAELLCYLAFPLLAPACAAVRRPAALVACFTAACAVPLVAYTFLGFDDAAITYQAGIFRAIGGFVAGAALCRLGQSGSRLPALAGRCTGVIVAATLLAVAVLSATGRPALLAFPLAALLVPALAQQRGRIDRVLSTRPLLWSGEVSVALYLTHVPWILAASTVITPARFPGAWGWLGIALYVAGALLIAAATYALVEKPGQVLMRRIGGHPIHRTAGRRAATGPTLSLAPAIAVPAARREGTV